MPSVYDRLNPMFLATRETFPGEKTFLELCEGFFGGASSADRASAITRACAGAGLLVHMANPEQIDDLFDHIEREKKVRFLSTSYLHQDIRTTVYAIGRGTGLILDPSKLAVDHVSVEDSATVTDARGRLVVSDHAAVPGLPELHRTLMENPRDTWSEVNVSFEGPAPILGIFSLDGAMSKIFAAALHLKSGRRLPIFAYNRESNRFIEFVPTRATLAASVGRILPSPLREHCASLLEMLE